MFDGILLPKLQKSKTKRRLPRKIRRLNITPLSQKYKMAANFIMKTADRKQWSRGRQGGWRHNYEYQAKTVRRDTDDWPQSRPQMFNFFPNSKIQFVNNVGLMNTVPLVDDSDWKQRTAQHIFSKDGTTKSRKVTSIFARQSRGAIKFTQFATPLLRLRFNSSRRNFSHSFFFFPKVYSYLNLKHWIQISARKQSVLT